MPSSSCVSPISRALACALVFGLSAVPARSQAQSPPLVVTGVAGTQVGPGGYEADGTRPGSVSFTVKNVTAQSQTMYASMPCNPSFGYLDYWDDNDVFQPADPKCPYFWTSVTIAAGGTASVAVPLRLTMYESETGGVSLKLSTNTSPAVTSIGVASVSWNPRTSVLTATSIPTTYTPRVYPKSTTLTVPGRSVRTQRFSLEDVGNAPATYSIAAKCSGSVTKCALTSAATVYVDLNAVAYADVNYTVGEIGSTGQVSLIVTAPPQASGLVQADTGQIMPLATDQIAPSLSFTPRGEYDPDIEDYDPLWITHRDTVFTVDACDVDGTVRTPVGQWNTVTVAPRSTTATTLCPSAQRATFVFPFQPGNDNTITFVVSDGVHTSMLYQHVQYDDAPEQAATIAAHPDRTVAINQALTDTFVVTNPGARQATYAISVLCAPDGNPGTTCSAVTGVPSSITLAPQQTVLLPFSYVAPAYLGRYVVLTASAKFTGALTTATTTRRFAATTAAVLPPRVTITPANGTTTTTSTTTVSVAVCDPDDNITSYSVNVGGQSLVPTYTASTVAGCKSAFTSTWSAVALQPWQQLISATATDAAGHVTTATSAITYTPPLTALRPDVTAASSARSYAAGAYSAAEFAVTNAGIYSATYTMRALCGTLPSCSTSPPVTLAPGASAGVTVNFMAPSPAGARDTVKLIATYAAPTGATIADTAVTAVAAPLLEATPLVRVYPLAVALQPTYVGMLSYDLTNAGSDPVTYSLAASVTAPFGFPNWYVPPDTVTVGGGQTRTIYLYTKAPATEGSTGTYTLRASYVTTTGATLSAAASSTVQSVVPRPALAVSPKNASHVVYPGVLWNQIAFAVSNIGNTYLSANATIIGCTGMATNCRLDPTMLTSYGVDLAVSASKSVIVDFDDTGASEGSITLRYGDPATLADSATIRLVRTASTVVLAVTPRSSVISASRSRPALRRFFIQNTGNTTGTVRYTAQCFAAPCTSQSKTTGSLAAKQVDSVDVGFTTRATIGTDSVRLIAVADQPYAATDTGTVRVLVDSIADLRVNARTTMAGTSIDRDQCLTIAVGSDAAYECGDLRIAHELPSLTTMGRTRTPTLLFNSRHLNVKTLFAADVTVAMGADVSSLVGRVYITGSDGQPVLVATRSFPWRAEWSGDSPRRVVIPADLRQFSTGAYHYTVAVDKNTTTSSAQVTDSGTVAVVNRSGSAFGAGWWLDGFEQIVPFNAHQRLWIAGDGTTRLYTRTSIDTVWTVEATVDRPDTLIVSTTGAQYRHLRNGAYVAFDNAGRHRSTVSVAGQVTTFNYDDATHWDRLTSIDLPVKAGATAAHRYGFVYGYATSNATYLSSVVPPPVGARSRIVTIDHLSGTANVSRISSPNPDPTGVQFGYDAGRLTARTDRAGYTTTFSYDADAETVTGSRLAMQGTGDDIVRTFCAAEGASVIPCALGAVDSRAVATWYDGPLAIADTTRFVVDRFGAPTQITDALGHITTIGRNDARWPMLATAVVRPNAFTTQATYNDRGLMTSETAVNPLDAADRHNTGNATSVYAWNPGRFDVLDSIIDPTGTVTRFGYDEHGDRKWEDDGRGVNSRVWYGYNADRQLATIQIPGNATSQVERYDYDASLGNVYRRTSPMGFATTYHTDAVGRVDSVYAPLDGGQYSTIGYAFDVNDRVLTERDYGPPIEYTPPSGTPTSTPALTRWVITLYDAEGRPTHSTRSSTPDLNNVYELPTDWSYDGAGRKLTETRTAQPTERWRYDAAGNTVGWVTANGPEITMGYDALGRLQWRVTPQVVRKAEVGAKSATDVCVAVPKFPYFAPGGYEFDPLNTSGQCVSPYLPPDLVIARDSAAYAYDIAGNMIAATNNDAEIARDYYNDGALRTEIERVTVSDTLITPAEERFVHRYRLDYSYDLAGRRLARRDSIPRCMGCVQTYHYDRVSGLLDLITDAGEGRPAANFAFAYDDAGRLSSRSVNQSVVTEAWTFDPDGRAATRAVSGGGTAVYGDVFTYDPGGRITSMSISSALPGLDESNTQVYDGLGALVASSRQRNTLLVDEYVNDALGNRAATRRWLNGASMGHQYHYSREQLNDVSAVEPPWVLTDLPPLEEQQVLDTTSNFYDLAGNVIASVTGVARFQTGSAPGWRSDLVGREWTWNAYGADDRLRVNQRSFIDTTGNRTVFSEYRYDALGRRVLARSRWDQYCHIGFPPTCQSTLDRIIWDGDQILTELRSDGRSTSEAEATFGNNFLGAVRYTQGLDLDEPLAVWKSDVGGIVPHRSWRGTYEAGTGIDGSTLNVNWPARTKDLFFAPDTRVDPIQPTHWLGSLLEGKSEPSGLMYMRNRYYDPKTGRFTQEDPIGLAGGVNRYGFAGGDPVDLDDPFGLCPNCGGGAIDAVGETAVGGAAAAAALIHTTSDINLVVAGLDAAVDWLKQQLQIKFVTYTRTGIDGQVYSGRTSGFGDPQSIVNARANRHDPRLAHFGPPVVDAWGAGVQGRAAIRGREQQLIDFHGGAQSDGGTSANLIRGVSRANPLSGYYDAASTAAFGALPRRPDPK